MAGSETLFQAADGFALAAFHSLRRNLWRVSPWFALAEMFGDKRL